MIEMRGILGTGRFSLLSQLSFHSSPGRLRIVGNRLAGKFSSIDGLPQEIG
jgi:hypothetical protein